MKNINTGMNNIRIVNVPRHDADKQIYMQSFCESWIRCGGSHVERGGWIDNAMLKNAAKVLALTGMSFGRGKAFLVCARGGHLLKASLPYNFYGEIVPMLWDCWPDTWPRLERDIRLLGCRTVFMTASDAILAMSARLPDVRFVHVPEGVDMNDYRGGKKLEYRKTDAYELGRKHEAYHEKLLEGGFMDKFGLVYCPKKRKGTAFVFDTWDAFTEKLRDTKIIISFPASMTDARKAQVETLTIRYWEAMLSGCLIVGHCPKELQEIMGYDPVVEADMDNPAGQLARILANISDYQQMVDKNYEAARRLSSWDVRMEKVFGVLGRLGYCKPGGTMDT